MRENSRSYNWPFWDDRATRCCKALLDNQNQQTRFLQINLSPASPNPSNGENPAAQQASPPLAASSGGGILQHHRHGPEPDATYSVSWEIPVRPRDCAPFAAELDIINQLARNSGPTRRTTNPEHDSRRRDTGDSEHETHRLFSCHEPKLVLKLFLDAIWVGHWAFCGISEMLTPLIFEVLELFLVYNLSWTECLLIPKVLFWRTVWSILIHVTWAPSQEIWM